LGSSIVATVTPTLAIPDIGQFDKSTTLTVLPA
jgi:hypothetical protein